MEHTKTLRVEKHRASNLPGSSSDGRNWILYIETDEKESLTVARVHGDSEEDVTQRAYNIVQAVNAYDKDKETIKELVGALKDIVDKYENMVFAFGSDDEADVRSSFEQAKKAIAKAEGNNN